MRLFLAFALLCLSACELSLPDIPGIGLRQVKILDGALTIAAPRGYCIDPESSVNRGDTVVALIGRCTSGGQVAAALLSMTIGEPGSAGVLAAGPETLAKFFMSPTGRRILARDGVASHVTVQRARVEEGALMLLLDDRETGEYWRSFSGIRGRLVTISALGAVGAPLTPDQGYGLVQETLTLLQKRNRDRAPLARLGTFSFFRQ